MDSEGRTMKSAENGVKVTVHFRGSKRVQSGREVCVHVYINYV